MASWLARWRNPLQNVQLSWNLLVAALVFSAPTHFFLVLDHSAGYVRGLRVDYLLPKLYLSVLVATLIIGWWLWHFKPWRNWYWQIILRYKWFISLIALLIFSQFFTTYPMIALWFLLQLGILLISGWLVLKHRSLVRPVVWISIFSGTALFQTSLALWQWLQQRPLVGYQLIGEPSFDAYTSLARTTRGAEWILPYGTTAHPNVLGGFLAIVAIVLIRLWYQQKGIFWQKQIAWVGVIAAVAGVFLSQSASALLVLVFGGALILLPADFLSKFNISIKQLILYLSLLLLAPILLTQVGDTTDSSWYRRIELNRAAVQMLQAYPLGGVGLHHFTVYLEEVSQLREFVRFVQPAHHVLLLWLAETGVLGLTILFWGLIKVIRTSPIPAIYWSLMPILVLDHYLLTMPVGILMVTVLAISSESKPLR